MSRYQEIDLKKIKTLSITARESNVHRENLAKPFIAGSDFKTFLSGLPGSLKAEQFRLLVEKIVSAVDKKKPVLVMMGAHVIKVGVSPIVIDLMKSGIITGLAMNGAGAIHDLELSLFGKTSENVAEHLKDGSFGMVKETAEFLNAAVKTGADRELGFGEAVGQKIAEEYPEHSGNSLFASAWNLNIPLTVHAALGTDIIHQHPSADGGAIGNTSMRDFRIWTRLVAELNDGGVLLLFGSAVLLPEVFLKALTVARNIYGTVENFTTASFDMIQHYRPQMNVIERPNAGRGTGIVITGHHELMIPLLAAAVKEALQK